MPTHNLEVEKWAQKICPIVAESAIQLVTFSDFLYEILPQAKDRCIFDYSFSLPDFTSWFKLYRSPLKPLIAFVNTIAEFEETGAKLKMLLLAGIKLYRQLRRNPKYLEENPPPPETIQYWINFINDIRSNIYSLYREDLDLQPFEPAEKIRFHNYIKSHELELGFFFFLYVPCLLIYQTSPRNLYRQAVSDDPVAIEKLLKLDPLMLHNPIIGQLIQNRRFTHRTNEYEKLIKASLKPAVTRFSDIADARKRWKVVLAAIMSTYSEALGHPLNSSQIAALFRAYAKDKKTGLDDEDLPVGESLDKAIERHSPPWQELFQNLDNKK